MAKNERDDLFDLSLGDGLIDIPDADEQPEKEEETKPEKQAGKEKKDDEEVTVYEDGMIEVNEFAPSKSKDLDKSADDEEADEVTKKTDKKKDTGKAPSDDGSSDSSPSSSPYLAFAKDRAEEGVFLEFSDEDWTELVKRNDGDEAQALRELHALSLQQMVKSGVEKYKESLTPEEKLLYEAKEKGLPLDKYSIAKRNHSKYSKITAEQVKEDPKVAEDVMSKFLELKGFTPEEAKEEIEGYKALENLETKALKALEFVPKAFEKEVKRIEDDAKAEEDTRKDHIRQRVARMKSLVENTPEIIPGIKLNKTSREKIMESMTTPVATDKDGNPLNPVMATRQKNPEGFELMLHYYHELGLFNIDKEGRLVPDFSKITKIGETKSVDTMRSIFESSGKTTKGKAAKVVTKEDEEDEFDKAFARLGKY
jgi:hypothetical protein